MILKKIDTYLTAQAKTNNVAGAILIARKNTLLLRKGYGYANQETHEQNYPNTVFKIASITKIFTAIAILKLQEEQQIHVHDTLDRYIPDCFYGAKVMIHHLLSMTSGIVPHTISPTERQKSITPAQLVDMIKNNPLLCSPGTQFHYNNWNYVLLAYIIEKVTGVRYATYLKNTILDPLGMCATYVDDGSNKPHQALGYTLSEGNLCPSNSYDMSWTFGSGNIHSTVNDLYLFDKALHSGTLLKPESYRCMQTAVMQTRWNYWAQKEASYGYGLVIGPAAYNNETTIGHGGGTGSFASYLFHFLPSETTIIALINYGSLDVYTQELLAKFIRSHVQENKKTPEYSI